jgi:hypothetical protein
MTHTRESGRNVVLRPFGFRDRCCRAHRGNREGHGARHVYHLDLMSLTVATPLAAPAPFSLNSMIRPRSRSLTPGPSPFSATKISRVSRLL